MNGYKESDKIDKLLASILEKHPIKDNAREWMKLTIVIESTISIIQTKAMQALRKEHEKATKAIYKESKNATARNSN